MGIPYFFGRGDRGGGNSYAKLSLFIFRTLDLSFNLIKTIENLGCLTKVKKLFLVSNKVSKIEGLQNLLQLEMIELGANKIRVSIKYVCTKLSSYFLL